MSLTLSFCPDPLELLTVKEKANGHLGCPLTGIPPMRGITGLL